MISRIARVQVLVFAVLSAVGVTFVGLRYVGLGERLRGGYVVHADLAAAGGAASRLPRIWVASRSSEALRLTWLPTMAEGLAGGNG